MVIFQPYVVDVSTEFELLICKVEKNYRAELRSRVIGTKSNWIVISSANLSEAQNSP